ncbi:MAG: NAD(+) synthase [Candidatus Diapherotrites archaeon CG08_land_8_20_14_0_20_34_12]|nr:MAG: NAD(+) synthase [Candidatus Diapherotrites archaeon CG08_land_8_20_14_0_20_34_12]
MNAEKIFLQVVSYLRKYAKQNNFKKAILGLSGGIDSAVVACLAKEAFGPENVLALFMPSKFTASHNFEDSKKLAEFLNIDYEIIPIHNLFDSYLRELKILDKKEISRAEENLQSRIRSNILMAYSNKFNYLVLSTGNKSEIMTGYFTLYGDATGALAPLGDIYKMQVYELAEYINKRNKKEIIPKKIFEKKPSAELKHNQTDQDTLPAYPLLDKILGLYLDKNKSEKQIIKAGFDSKTVKKVIQMVKDSEFKRTQIPKAIPLEF